MFSFAALTRGKRVVVASVVAVALGGAVAGALGIAYAQQTPTPTPRGTGAPPQPGKPDPRMQQFLDKVASKLGVSSDRLKQAIEDARKETGFPGPGPFGRPGGPRGPGGPGRIGRPGFPPGGPGFLDTAAKTIGIGADQLRQELPGKSLADVAKAHNVDAKKVADALKADAAAQIDQTVKNGRLTADQATQRKQEASARIDQLMTQAMPARPQPPFGTRPGGPGGPGGPPPGPPGQRPATPGTAGTPAAPGTASPRPGATGTPSATTRA